VATTGCQDEALEVVEKEKRISRRKKFLESIGQRSL
jgi:hypothetical protein